MSVKNKWLIKSDYKILGPYSYEQVEDLIMKKQISLIDEIRDMNLRWSYVREVPDFKVLVDAIREELDQKAELTQTMQTGVAQRTNTSAMDAGTITASHRSNFSEVELPEMNPPDFEQEFPKKEIQRPSFKTPAFEQAATVSKKKQFSFNSKSLMVFAVLLFCIVGGWYYSTIFNQNKNDKIIFQQIRKYNLYAQDDKSIELFKKLSVSSQDKIAVDIIPIWLKLEAAGIFNSSRILDLINKGKVVGNERKSQYQLVKFNRAFNLGDIQNAKEALVKAIDLDPSSVDVKENDAIFSFAQNKYEDSARIFKNLYDISNQGRYLYGYVLSLINAKKSLNESTAFQMIDKHVRYRLDFNKELLFLQMYLIKKGFSGNSDLYSQYLNMFLDFPGQMTQYFKINSLVNRNNYNWKDLEAVRQDLVSIVEKRDGVLLNIHFYLEKGDISQAQDLYYKNQNILNESDRYNLDIAFSYHKKNYQNALGISPEGKTQSLASQIYMLKMHIETKSNHSIIMHYINKLMKSHLVLSNWALLMTAKMPDDKEHIKTLINKDRIYSNEFLPYLEFKASTSND